MKPHIHTSKLDRQYSEGFVLFFDKMEESYRPRLERASEPSFVKNKIYEEVETLKLELYTNSLLRGEITNKYKHLILEKAQEAFKETKENPVQYFIEHYLPNIKTKAKSDIKHTELKYYYSYQPKFLQANTKAIVSLLAEYNALSSFQSKLLGKDTMKLGGLKKETTTRETTKKRDAELVADYSELSKRMPSSKAIKQLEKDYHLGPKAIYRILKKA
jgi:hypothetical protein